MLILNTPPIITSNDGGHYKQLVEGQSKADKSYDSLRNYNFIPVGSAAVV